MESIRVAAVSMNSPFGAQDEVMDRIESPPVDHPNPPYHAGGAMIIEPAGTILVHAQLDRIRDEMVVGTLDPARLAEARSRAN